MYRPQDVYINELFGGLSQLDDGVTTVHDVSQISHTPAHSDAAIQALIDTGRRAAFGYFESAGNFGAGVPGNQYPQDAPRILKQWFSPGNLSRNGLVHMIMGGEVYLGNPTTDKSWTIGRRSWSADRGAYPLAVRHPPDFGLARRRNGRQRPHRDRPRTTCSST